MKVYLLSDIENIGIAGEIVKVKEGFALNFLLPYKKGIRVTSKNESFYAERAKKVEHRKEVISSKTSMLSERIKDLKLIIKRKMHDDGKLYASINPSEIVELLAKEGVTISRGQVKIAKTIKEQGNFSITIKLTSKLQPSLQLKVISEKSKSATA